MKSFRIGVRTRLFFGFVAAGSATLVLSFLGIYTFVQFNRGQEVIADKKIPVMNIASDIVLHGREIIALVREVMDAPDAASREASLARMNDLAEAINDDSARLSGAGVDESRLQGIKSSVAELVSAIEELARLSEDRIGIERGKQDYRSRLLDAYDEFEESAGGGESGAEVGEARRLLSRAMLLVLAAGDADDGDECAKIERAYMDMEGEIPPALANLGPDLRSKGEACFGLLRGGGIQDMFARQAALNVAEQDALVISDRAGAASSRLSAEVENLNGSIRAEIGSFSELVGDRLERMSVIFTVLSAFAAAIFFATSLIVGNSVAGRLETLRESMQEHARGRHDAAVPLQGNDEITDMAGTLRYFVSEIRRREEELRASEERYRRLFDNSISGISICEIVLDDEGHAVDYINLDVNRAFEVHYGIEAGQIINRRITEVIPRDEMVELIEIYGRVVQSGEPVRCEMHLETLGRYFEIQSYPLGGRNFAVISMDITDRENDAVELRGYRDHLESLVEERTAVLMHEMLERRSAEADLEAEEERYRTIFTSANDAFLIFDESQAIVEANPAACAMYGYSRDELIGRTTADIIDPGHLRSRDGGGSGRRFMESVHVRRDGSRFDVEVLDSNFTFRKKPHLLGVVRDITERKQAERTLLDYQDKLRSLASELTLAEAGERRRIAVEVHDHVGQALAMIQIKLEQLKSLAPGTGFSEPLDKLIPMVERANHDIRTLIFELSPPILYEFGLEAALEWLAEKYHDEHAIVSTFEDDGGQKPLGEDVRVLLFQSVRELLVNIVKHAHAEKIRISMGRVSGRVRISIEDDGRGFDYADSQRAKRGAGGFGLFNIRERLRDIGGEFIMDSKPGQGTRAVLTAPLMSE